MSTEKHPFEPFLPANAHVLFLGSFPPPSRRWSMVFFYPNYTNDFWYLIGRLWFGDKFHFAIRSEKRFDKERIVEFCRKEGFAMYDTAAEVRRLKDNASDQFLEVVTPTDIPALLAQIPECQAIVTTGQKATDTLCAAYACPAPAIGQKVQITIPTPDSEGIVRPRTLDFYRMPSTSRAYPLPQERKAEAYGAMFRALGMLP